MREELIEALKNREFSRLRRDGDIKKTISTLISLLYDDELYMFRAAEAIGCISKILVERDVEMVKEVIRRMFWYLNEENAGYCPGAPLVIGEIGRNIREEFEDFINPTASLLEDPGLETKYVIYAVGRIGRRILKSKLNVKDELLKLLEDTNPEIRGYAIKAVRELGIAEALPKLGRLLNDQTGVTIYEEGYYMSSRISELAFETLRSLLQLSSPFMKLRIR